MNAHEIVSHTLKLLAEHTRVGVTTLTLNNLAEKEIRDLGGIPACKNYKPEWADSPFPAALCTSVNNQIAHGMPSERKLKDGDLINFDLGVTKDGECGDAALTVGVGNISSRDRELLKTAKKALLAGIAVLRDGVEVREIAHEIEKVAKSKGFVVNRTFAGHQIGKEMHQEPYIYHASNWLFNFPNQFHEYEKYMKVRLTEGMVVCLEPILTYSDRFGTRANNHWTFVTKDGGKCAMFEHMIRITKTGHEVLTTHIESSRQKGDVVSV